MTDLMRPVRTDDPYALLDVPRDASPERIRRAYELEVQRAHRNGATAHAVALSSAYDTLSDPARRALFDRHGLAPVRERSPGAATPPTPWRIVKQQPPSHVQQHASRGRRTWRAPGTTIFCLGLVAGLAVAAYLQRQVNEATARLPPQQQVVCDATPTGAGYTYTEAGTNPPSCTNGAVPRILR